jgi:hypothetical protein
LEQLGVRLIQIFNRVNEDYGYANKIDCLNVKSTAVKTIFLDSDILCLRPVSDDAFPAVFNAKAADQPTWGRNEGPWREVYAAFGLPFPTRRIAATTSGDSMPPYFNAGFAATWEKCCVDIDEMESIAKKRPHLDQIGLSVAVAKLGLDFRCLGEEYNFPLHLKTLTKTPPIFCHYHWPSVIRREALLVKYVDELVAAYPQLKELIEGGCPQWRRVLEPRATAPTTQRKTAWWDLRQWSRAQAAETAGDFPEVVITGIPRSGTSLLCKRLDDLSNCVILNEPAEIFDPLTHGMNPFWLATYYRDLRSDILDGREIENKINNGKVVEDTRHIDERIRYRPGVSGADFLLGTKNTLAYLARLSIIKRAMPHATIVACIRHPLDTIASWKGSFAHLRDVQFNDFPVAYTENPFLTGVERTRLDEIQNTDNPAIRRALLWSHLAETIKSHEEGLVIVRYEDLVATPDATIRRILAAVSGFDVDPPRMQAMQRRSRRDLLDNDDYQAVTDLCATHAAHFDYLF